MKKPEDRIVEPPEDVNVKFCPKCGNIKTKSHDGSIFCFTWIPRHNYPKQKGTKTMFDQMDEVQPQPLDLDAVRQALQNVHENLEVLRAQGPAIKAIHDVREQFQFSMTLWKGWVSWIHLLVQDPRDVLAALDEYENEIARLAAKANA